MVGTMSHNHTIFCGRHGSAGRHCCMTVHDLLPQRTQLSAMPPSTVCCMQGKTVVAVTSGANMNFDRLRLVAELAGVGARKEAMLVTTIPEAAGSFARFISTALADNLQLTEFKYRCGCLFARP